VCICFSTLAAPWFWAYPFFYNPSLAYLVLLLGVSCMKSPNLFLFFFFPYYFLFSQELVIVLVCLLVSFLRLLTNPTNPLLDSLSTLDKYFQSTENIVNFISPKKSILKFHLQFFELLFLKRIVHCPQMSQYLRSQETTVCLHVYKAYLYFKLGWSVIPVCQYCLILKLIILHPRKLQFWENRDDWSPYVKYKP
jgi:hypothetical protein